MKRRLNVFAVSYRPLTTRLSPKGGERAVTLDLVLVKE